jgi:very-short-patch-repair endonuclease
MAAVLACGLEAVLSHTSAAVVWGLLPTESGEGPVHVSIRDRYRILGPGIRVHRVRTLEPDETTILDGIPITTPARTLLDLASSSGQRALEGAVARAERLGLADRGDLVTLVGKRRWVRGAPALGTLLAQNGPPAFTRSEAEAEFLDLVRRARLPTPSVNSKVKGYEVDFLWRSARLIAEVDGFAFHSSRDAFERDRERDGVLVAAGFRVLRVTWRQLTREPEAVLARLLRALEQTGG